MIRRLFLIFSLLFIYTRVFALPDISGNISDETWTKDNSPYHITGNTTVTNLTIESGVEVLFDDDYEFNINGNFSAIGAKNDTIYFRPDTNNSNDYPGLHVQSSSESVEFSYCRIEGSNNYGILFESSQAIINNSLIRDVDGFGIALDSSRVTIHRSSIIQNSDHGIQITNLGKSYLYNCIVSYNGNSGIYTNNGLLSLTNSIVSFNNNAGIFLQSTDDTLNFENSTIAYHTTNNAITAIGGIINGTNSIIYHNNNSYIGNATPIISFSNVEGSYTGEGNIDQDPDFIDIKTLKLSASSPCIDKGNPQVEYEDICFPPSQGTAVNDMGAYGGPISCYWYDQMVVMPESLNFANVTVGDTAISKIVVKNYRDTPLELESISLTGPDSAQFRFNQSPINIAAFDSLIIYIQFDPNSEKNFQANLIISSPNHSINIDLSGNGVTPSININLTKLDFEKLSVRQETELSFILSNVGLGTLRVTGMLFSNPSFFTNHALPIEIESLEDSVISVIFKPDTNISYQDTLFIENNDPNNSVATLRLEGVGTAPVLYPSQSEINFGKLIIYQTIIDSITITNTGQDTLKISNVQLIDNETNSFTLEDFFTTANIAPGATTDLIKIAFNPQTAENHDAKLQIISNDPFNNPFEINLNGRGVKPTLDISGQNLDFGEVIVGDSLTNTIWIKNSGDTTLRIENIEIADNINFTFADINFPLTINQQDSSDALKITYTPKSEVSDSAGLIFTSNDPDLTNFDTLITGTGIRPILTTNPSDSLNFGEVVVGDSSWNGIELTNTGSGTLRIDTIHIGGNDSQEFRLDSLNYPITLNPDSSVLLGIKFLPESQGDKHSDLIIESNNVETSSLSIVISGLGVEPQIQIIPQQIDFDTVYIGDSISDNLDINNIGKGILRIDSILISDTLNFSYAGITVGDTLLADSSITMQVWFHPAADFTGEKEATLTIVSNDPDNAVSDVSLEGISKTPVVIDINPKEIVFDSTFINAQDTARISVHNPGDFTLIVYNPELKSGENNYSVLGIEDSLLIPSNQGTEFSVLFTPQIEGPIVDTLIVKSNDPLNPEELINLYGVGMADTSEVDFTVAVSIDTLDFEASEHVFSVQIIKEGPSISGASLFLRQGGQINYEEINLTPQVNDTWSTQIPSETMSARGLEYYVQAIYPGGDAAYPDSGQKYPAISIIKNVYGDFLDPTSTGQYQMISLPLDAGQQDLSNLFGDNLGAYYNTKYRLFDWNYEEDKYIELSNMDATLAPGKSLWLITAESKQLDYSKCSSISSDNFYAIDLHYGWNMIASPFAFNIDISSINKTPLRGEVIYDYHDADWIPRADSLLLPFKGYAVFAEFASTLFIPNTEAGQSLDKMHKIDEGEWHIKLIVSRDQMHDRYNFAGVRALAKNDMDRLDYPEPPKIGNFVELYFRQQDSKLTGDFRVPGNDGYLYDFLVNSNVAGESKIEAITMNLPEEFSWEIISPKTGINYHQGPVITSAKQQEFQLAIGTNDFIEKSVSGYKNKPETFQIAQNYPNPFNPETQIRFEVPQPSRISIDIFDIMGRKIKSLANQNYYNSGYYEVRWDGRNDRGENVASGLYLLYLRSANYKKAIKMILQR
jgi:hypothetical protein